MEIRKNNAINKKVSIEKKLNSSEIFHFQINQFQKFLKLHPHPNPLPKGDGIIEKIAIKIANHKIRNLFKTQKIHKKNNQSKITESQKTTFKIHLFESFQVTFKRFEILSHKVQLKIKIVKSVKNGGIKCQNIDQIEERYNVNLSDFCIVVNSKVQIKKTQKIQIKRNKIGENFILNDSSKKYFLYP